MTMSERIEFAQYKMFESMGRLLLLPCNTGDTVYDVVLCDDGLYRVFEMVVCSVVPYGALREGKVWNVYLESDYIDSYMSFYDFEQSVFVVRQDAEYARDRFQKIKDWEDRKK